VGGAHGHLPQALAERILEGAKNVGDGWKVPPIPATVFNVNAADREWVDRQTTMHPLAAMEEHLRLTGGAHEHPRCSSLIAGCPFDAQSHARNQDSSSS